jgi:hypothetical protein
MDNHVDGKTKTAMGAMRPMKQYSHPDDMRWENPPATPAIPEERAVECG